MAHPKAQDILDSIRDAIRFKHLPEGYKPVVSVDRVDVGARVRHGDKVGMVHSTEGPIATVIFDDGSEGKAPFYELKPE